MVEYLHDACFSNAACLKILHSIFSGEVYSLHLRHWVRHQVGLLANLGLGSLLENVDLVADKNLDGNLASSLALSDPLLDPLESGPLGYIEEVNDGS